MFRRTVGIPKLGNVVAYTKPHIPVTELYIEQHLKDILNASSCLEGCAR